jgi:hypothetical protein
MQRAVTVHSKVAGVVSISYRSRGSNFKRFSNCYLVNGIDSSCNLDDENLFDLKKVCVLNFVLTLNYMFPCVVFSTG